MYVCYVFKKTSLPTYFDIFSSTTEEKNKIQTVYYNYKLAFHAWMIRNVVYYSVSQGGAKIRKDKLK